MSAGFKAGEEVAFGSGVERLMLPVHTSPTRLGIEQGLRGEPHRGPGCYTSDLVGKTTHICIYKCTQTTHTNCCCEAILTLTVVCEAMYVPEAIPTVVHKKPYCCIYIHSSVSF